MSAAVPEEPSLRFDAERKSKSLQVDNNGKSLVQMSDGTWNACLGSTAMPPGTGTYRWRMVLEDIGRTEGHTTFGVAVADASLENYIGHDGKSWALAANGNLYHNKDSKSGRYI
jgi:outer membrane protein assembly factor BamB